MKLVLVSGDEKIEAHERKLFNEILTKPIIKNQFSIILLRTNLIQSN